MNSKLTNATAGLVVALFPVFAKAQEESRHTIGVLDISIVIYAIDEKCGILSNFENDTLRQIIEFELNSGDLTDEEIRHLWESVESGELSEDVPCDDPELDAFFEPTRELIESMNSLAAEAAGNPNAPSPHDLTGEAAIAGLLAFMDGLTPGQLPTIEGCWRGVVGVWETEFCFGPGGDGVTMTTMPPSRAFSCRLEGEARNTDGDVLFYALPMQDSCQTAATMSHFGARCRLVSNQLECEGALAVNAEDTYLDEEIGSYVAGIFVLGRESDDVLRSMQLTYEMETRDLPRGQLAGVDGCSVAQDFFGVEAELCFFSASDTGRLTISEPRCILEGEAIRMTDSFVVAGLFPTDDCSVEFAILTSGCEEIDDSVLECFVFGMKDGFTFFDRFEGNVRVPFVGSVSFGREPL